MIATDKILHTLAGATIGFTVALLAGWIVALICVLAAGAGKEVYDKFHPDHTVDLYDALATVGGGMYAIAIVASQQTF